MKEIINEQLDKVNVGDADYRNGIIIRDIRLSFIGFVVHTSGQLWCMNPFGGRFGNAGSSILELMSLNPNYKFYQL